MGYEQYAKENNILEQKKTPRTKVRNSGHPLEMSEQTMMDEFHAKFATMKKRAEEKSKNRENILKETSDVKNSFENRMVSNMWNPFESKKQTIANETESETLYTLPKNVFKHEKEKDTSNKQNNNKTNSEKESKATEYKISSLTKSFGTLTDKINLKKSSGHEKIANKNKSGASDKLNKCKQLKDRVAQCFTKKSSDGMAKLPSEKDDNSTIKTAKIFVANLRNRYTKSESTKTQNNLDLKESSMRNKFHSSVGKLKKLHMGKSKEERDNSEGNDSSKTFAMKEKFAAGVKRFKQLRGEKADEVADNRADDVEKINDDTEVSNMQAVKQKIVKIFQKNTQEKKSEECETEGSGNSKINFLIVWLRNRKGKKLNLFTFRKTGRQQT